MVEESKDVQLSIQGMDCADCALSLERSLGQIKGVEQVTINFTTGLLDAVGTFDTQEIIKRVEVMGYHASTDTSLSATSQGADHSQVEKPRHHLPGFLGYLYSATQTRLALAGAILLIIALPLSLFQSSSEASLVKTILHILAAVIAGFPIANRGIRAMIFGKQITIDLLMSIATLGALIIGETGEGATVVLLFAIGEALEGYTADRARSSLRSLLDLKPDLAHVMRPCIDCTEHLGQQGYTGGPCPLCGEHETTVPVEQVSIGEIVIVRPSERIPVDGQVVKGSSLVDQAPVTGESVPVNKSPGEDVYAGTLNGEAVLEVRVSQVSTNSMISRIVRLVEQAQSKRAPIERFIDKFAAWYTPVVVILAALVATLPPLLFSEPFLDTNGTRGWLYRALALLIIACPCALVISTPVTLVSALTSLARRGILVKGGAFLELLSQANIFAFDKTGTLTQGKPKVTMVKTLACLPNTDRCKACDDMLALAATVERRSEHPLAQAIMEEAVIRQVAHTYPAAESIRRMTGQGVQGILNGSRILVGSHDLFHTRETELECELHEDIQTAIEAGQTVMLVGKDERFLGFVSVADVARETSAAALGQLKSIDEDIRTVMLTGDNPAVAAKIANSLNSIDEVQAGLMPEDKLEAVRQLQTRHEIVVMVGDGVNDAPALAAANVGIAMGGAGNAQAMETADVVLMQDDLNQLPEIIRTARKTSMIVKQNIAFSLAIKAVFLILTLPGWATLWMAVFADMGASLLVTLNGLRMLRKNGKF